MGHRRHNFVTDFLLSDIGEFAGETMRFLVPALVSAALAASPALAETWTEYSYPELGFAIQFPGLPVAEPGRLSPAEHVYSLDQDGIVYRVTVTDVADRNADKDRLIEQTIAPLRAMGSVQLESRPRVDANYGRAIVVAGRDGNRYTEIIFFIGRRLYQLTGTYVPPHPTSGYVMRFQMSFRLLR